MIRQLLPLLALVAFGHATAKAQRPPTPCTTPWPVQAPWRSWLVQNVPSAHSAVAFAGRAPRNHSVTPPCPEQAP